MESYQHLVQMILLLESLELFWKDRADFFAAGNLTIYFSPRQLKTEHFRGPDFFVVLGTERRPRKSWVVWEEDGRYPNVIVEVLSESTESTDRGLKKQIYQDVFRRRTTSGSIRRRPSSRASTSSTGSTSRSSPDASGRLWSAQLELFLGVEEGQLRFFTLEGELVPAGKELAKRAESAEQRARVRRAARRVRRAAGRVR